MPTERAELSLVADFTDALRRFGELYQRWKETVERIEAAAAGTDLDALEAEAEELGRELVDVGREGAGALRQLERGATESGKEVGDLTRQVDRLEGELKRTTERAEDFKRVGAGAFSGLRAGIAGVAGALAAIGIGRALAAVVQESGEAEVAVAKVRATLEATGQAAGLTLPQIQAIATGLQDVTTSGDEANLELLAMLLTFKNLGGEILPEVAERVLDVAAVMETDTRSAAIQLGKALNDPVRGVTALSEAGIQFSDQQRDVIERLVETGRIAEAQRMILDELAGQVGGTARAIRGSLPGALEALKNKAGELAEQVGEGGLSKELRFATEAAVLFTEESEHGTTAAQGLGAALGAVVRAAVFIVSSYSRARSVVASFFASIIDGAASGADAVLRFVAAAIEGNRKLADALPGADKLFPGLEAGTQRALDAIRGLREGAVQDLRFIAEGHREVAKEQAVVADELAARLEGLRKELETTAPPVRDLGEDSDESAGGVRDLAAAAAGAVAPVQALADATAAVEPLDFTAFAPGAEDAAKRGEALATQAERLRQRIAELEGLPVKSTEQVGELFDATDQLARVERDLAAALEEAAPIISGGTSLVEDSAAAREEMVESTRRWVREEFEAGRASRETAEAVGALADEQERITQATERAPQAFADLAAAVDTTGIEVRDSTGALAESLAVQGDLGESLAGIKERLDLAGVAATEFAEAGTEGAKEQREELEKLTEEHRAHAESWRELAGIVEEQVRRMVAVQSQMAEKWRELNRLCEAHRDCLTRD